MKFGYTILYVDDVEGAIAFYEKAFGLKRRVIDPTGQYGELETGETLLAFVSVELAHENLPSGFRQNRLDELPSGFEIAFICDDVAKAYEVAVANGAKGFCPPEQKPWGQMVAYVRDPYGILVELASEMPKG